MLLTPLTLILIAGLVYLYLKFSNISLTTLLRGGEKVAIVAEKEPSAFGEVPLAYVKDSEIGIVLGEGRYNDVAGNFDAMFHLESARPEDISKIYKRYSISSVDGEVVKGTLLGALDITEFILECDPGQSALFKSRDIRFVSANLDVSKELKVGDALFTKCVTEACESVGPECIIIRFVRPPVSLLIVE